MGLQGKIKTLKMTLSDDVTTELAPNRKGTK
jgi:hypothetical protein